MGEPCRDQCQAEDEAFGGDQAVRIVQYEEDTMFARGLDMVGDPDRVPRRRS